MSDSAPPTHMGGDPGDGGGGHRPHEVHNHSHTHTGTDVQCAFRDVSICRNPGVDLRTARRDVDELSHSCCLRKRHQVFIVTYRGGLTNNHNKSLYVRTK